MVLTNLENTHTTYTPSQPTFPWKPTAVIKDLGHRGQQNALSALSVCSISRSPVGGAVVTVVGQEVVVEFPEDMQRDASVGGGDIVVGLTEHGVQTVQGQELAQELVGHPVDVQETFKFLQPKPKVDHRGLHLNCSHSSANG